LLKLKIRNPGMFFSQISPALVVRAALVDPVVRAVKEVGPVRSIG
jgi:hypothetical protein